MYSSIKNVCALNRRRSQSYSRNENVIIIVHNLIKNLPFLFVIYEDSRLDREVHYKEKSLETQTKTFFFLRKMSPHMQFPT